VADVAVGAGGVSTIWVGVGTGGFVSCGGGDEDAAVGTTVATTVTVLVAVPAGAAATGADGGGVAAPRGGRFAYPVAGAGAEPSGSGAVPRPPVPPEPSTVPVAPIDAWRAAGAPSAQPATTANGSPTTIKAKKTDLGDKRTSGTPHHTRKSYGFRT
jgi:hypothetical protein